MPQYPRFTTFKPGELEQCLKEIAPQANFSLPLHTGAGKGRQILWKNHTFAVTFPDGQEGTCKYERSGPQWHLFSFRYADGTAMPRQSTAHRLANDVVTIETKGRELAASCYQEAIREERRDYFQRASEPSDKSRKKRPEKVRMKAAKAREWAGLYTVCARSGEHLIPIGTLYQSIEKANADWRERSDARLVVGCCNRLDRCFDLPKFNPLYAECEMRPEFQGKRASTQDTVDTERTDEQALPEEEAEP